MLENLKRRLKLLWTKFRMWRLERKFRKVKPFFVRTRNHFGREWWKTIKLQHGLEEYGEEEGE